MATNQSEKLTGSSLDISAENRAHLKALFPTVFTETKNDKGELVESLDFERLKAELGTFSDVFESRRERYGMDWPGKKEALRLIQTPSYATLKPCREESVNFDTTENLFIEGDNLEVLKLLQKSYYGKVKMIYIDPPYNTGKEFIYPDNYTESLETYLEYAGLIDGDGKKFSTNTPNEGRFHTKWLNMMYPRLYLARNLLRDEGYICISIGEEELSNIVLACNDIFGEENRVTICSRVMKTGGQKGIHFSPSVDYIVIYAKYLTELSPFRAEISQKLIDTVYTKIETIGPKRGQKYRSMGLYQAMLDVRANQRYYIKCPDGELVIPPGSTFPSTTAEGEQIKPNDEDGVWRWTYSRYHEELENNNIEFVKSDRTSLVTDSGNPAKWNVYYKIWLGDRLDEGQLPGNILDKFESRHSSSELKALDIPFDFAKPSELIKYLIGISKPTSNDIILDFFAGSGTLGHSVLNYIKEESIRLGFICIQLPEKTNIDSEEYKAGYRIISDIGKERIRRVIKKIKEEQEGKLDLYQSPNQDLGFKVLKLGQSNFRQWEQLDPSTPPEKVEEELFKHIGHISDKATPEDLLYEILLKAGFTPTEKIETKTITGKTVFSIAGGALLLCLEDEVTKELINAVAELEPMQFICLDSAFHGNDQLKANAVQTFAARNMQKEKHNQIIFKTV